jgi:hypothetical protein
MAKNRNQQPSDFDRFKPKNSNTSGVIPNQSTVAVADEDQSDVQEPTDVVERQEELLADMWRNADGSPRVPTIEEQQQIVNEANKGVTIAEQEAMLAKMLPKLQDRDKDPARLYGRTMARGDQIEVKLAESTDPLLAEGYKLVERVIVAQLLYPTAALHRGLMVEWMEKVKEVHAVKSEAKAG